MGRTGGSPPAPPHTSYLDSPKSCLRRRLRRLTPAPPGLRVLFGGPALRHGLHPPAYSCGLPFGEPQGCTAFLRLVRQQKTQLHRCRRSAARTSRRSAFHDCAKGRFDLIPHTSYLIPFLFPRFRENFYFCRQICMLGAVQVVDPPERGRVSGCSKGTPIVGSPAGRDIGFVKSHL